MKNLLELSIIPLFLFSCAVQPKEQEAKSLQPVTPIIFDQKLADSLGADERGMKNYMLVILKTGPNDSKITDKSKPVRRVKSLFSTGSSRRKRFMKNSKVRSCGATALWL